MNLLHRGRLLIFMALVTLGILATAAAPVGAANIYVDPSQKFAIGVADGWTQRVPTRTASSPSGRSMAAARSSMSSTSASRSAPPAWTMLARTSTVSPPYSGYTEIRRDFVTCADQDCPILDYTAFDDGGELQRVQQVFVTKGSDGYVLTYRTRASDAERYRSDVELMVYSFSV